jgi:hypothetical protein
MVGDLRVEGARRQLVVSGQGDAGWDRFREMSNAIELRD